MPRLLCTACINFRIILWEQQLKLIEPKIYTLIRPLNSLWLQTNVALSWKCLKQRWFRCQILLEAARRLSKGSRSKRSIIFLALTAQEYGLLGSHYFAHYPPIPLSSMVANINLDMVAMLYSFADLIAFGAQHSSLKEAISAAALKNMLQ